MGYSKEEIKRDFEKVGNVLASCKTKEQIAVARKMLNLFNKKYTPASLRKKKERWYMPIVTLALTSALCGLVFIMATGGF